MATLQRMLQHWHSSKKKGRQLFPSSALNRFHNIIAEGAPRHRALLKLAIEVALPISAILRNASSRHRACTIFKQHCICQNGDLSHLLIYINLADKKVEIVVDNAAIQVLSVEQLDIICRRITHGFLKGNPEEGVSAALKELNALLEHTLPSGMA